MGITKLETMEQVEAAVREALAMPTYPRKAERERARRLADLFDMQAQLYREAGEASDPFGTITEIYRAACFIAAASFASRASQFAREAGSR
jgi:hypothetical protein